MASNMYLPKRLYPYHCQNPQRLAEMSNSVACNYVLLSVWNAITTVEIARNLANFNFANPVLQTL